MARRISNDLAYIDALRGIAIIAVVIAHVSQRLPLNFLRGYTDLGNLGVQLFFVVSGFTLARSASLRGFGNPGDWGAFYIRRVFRIAPLYWIGIATYAALAAVMAMRGAPERWAEYLPVNVLANVFLVHGLLPSANISIVHGGWSVGTEILFYLIFPALFVGLASKSWRQISAIAALVLLVSTALQVGHVASGYRQDADAGFWYSSLVNQLPVFVLGIAAYRAGRLPAPYLIAAATVGFALLIGLYERPAALFVFPSVAGACFALVTVLAAGVDRRCRWLETVGRLSYSIYVVHFVFATYALATFFSMAPKLSAVEQTAAFPIALGAAFACSCALAWGTHRWIERPAIALGSRVVEAYTRTVRQLPHTVAPAPVAILAVIASPELVEGARSDVRRDRIVGVPPLVSPIDTEK